MLGRFVRPGGVAFDVGAHVGDRTASFRRLGARAVAVEPQPAAARLLRRLFRRDPGVAVVAAAVGAVPGRLRLRLNRRNPTVASGSAAFVAAADGAAGWDGQCWDDAAEVEQTTLDALALAHGAPCFLKLDVEGMEFEALRGLSAAPPALSFEFTTIQRGVAADCLARLDSLARFGFNAALGEAHRFAHPAPLDAAAMAGWIAALPHAANSGDVYAALDADALRP